MNSVVGRDPQQVIAGLLSARLSQENGATYDLEAAISREWKSDTGASFPAPRTNSRRVTASGDAPPRNVGRSGDYARFKVNMGHRDHLHPGKLVNLLCTGGGITGSQIGAIRILTNETFFEVELAAAGNFFKQIKAAKGDTAVTVEAILDTSTPMPYSATPQRGRNNIARPSTPRPGRQAEVGLALRRVIAAATGFIGPPGTHERPAGLATGGPFLQATLRHRVPETLGPRRRQRPRAWLLDDPERALLIHTRP